MKASEMMLYTIGIYGEAGVFDALPKARQDEIMAQHRALQDKLKTRGDYVTMKLMPPTTAVTVEPAAEIGAAPLIVDGPFSETKESFLGFYAAEFTDLDEALTHAQMLASPIVRLEVRPVAWAGGLISTG